MTRHRPSGARAARRSTRSPPLLRAGGAGRLPAAGLRRPALARPRPCTPTAASRSPRACRRTSRSSTAPARWRTSCPALGAWVGRLRRRRRRRSPCGCTLMLVAVATHRASSTCSGATCSAPARRRRRGRRGDAAAARASSRYATLGPREKTTMVLPAGPAACWRWCTSAGAPPARSSRWPRSPGSRSLFPAIAGARWSPRCSAPHGPAAGALVRIAVGGARPDRAGHARAYAAIGKLQVFLDDFFLINLRYTEQGGAADEPGEAWDEHGRRLRLEPVGAARRHRRDAGDRASRDRPAAAPAARRGAPRWSRSPSHVLVCVAVVVQGVQRLAGRLLRAARPRCSASAAWSRCSRAGCRPGRARPCWRPGRVVATGLSLPRLRRRAATTTLDEQRADVDGRDGDPARRTRRIASVEAPQPLVLAHQRNLSRFQLFGNGLDGYVDDTWPGGTTATRGGSSRRRRR